MMDDGSFIKVPFHVDDGLCVHKGEELWQWYLKELKSMYAFSQQEVSYYVGQRITVDRPNKTIVVDQNPATAKILRAFDAHLDKVAISPVNNLSATLPTRADVATSAEEKEYVSTLPLLQCQGSLQWIFNTVPEISYAIKVSGGLTGKYPSRKLWKWMKRILAYLRGYVFPALYYRVRAKGHVLVCYSDANHAKDPDTRKSLSGGTFFYRGCLIMAVCKTQSIPAHHTMEAELMSMDLIARHSTHLKRLIHACGGRVNFNVPIAIDASSTYDVVVNPVHPNRNHHLHAQFFYVKQLRDEGEITPRKVDSKEMYSDVLVTFKDDQTFIQLTARMKGYQPHFQSFHEINDEFAATVERPHPPF